MRLIPKFICLLLASLAATTMALAADNGQTPLVPNERGDPGAAAVRVSFQAILVIASDEGATDPSLSAHQGTLKRVLRFKSFRRVGEAATSLSSGGEATVAIGDGYNLDLWVIRITDDEVEYGARWFKGRLTLANTKVTRPRRSNTVVAGPGVEGGKGTYAVIVTTN